MNFRFTAVSSAHAMKRVNLGKAPICVPNVPNTDAREGMVPGRAYFQQPLAPESPTLVVGIVRVVATISGCSELSRCAGIGVLLARSCKGAVFARPANKTPIPALEKPVFGEFFCSS